MSRVGFVGAGQMGLPMVEMLVTDGHDVVVHARRPEARVAVSELGARATSDLTIAAEDRDIVIVCLYDDQQLTDVATPVMTALPRAGVLASHVTGRIATLTDLAARFPDKSIVDAPISGVPEHIRTRQLTVLLGGEPEARAVAEVAMSSYAAPVIHTGALGTALPVKLINNLLMAANTQLLAEGLKIGQCLGVTEDVLLTALDQMSGGSRAVHYAFQLAGLRSLVDKSAPYLIKDVQACRAEAAELHLDLGLLDDVIDNGVLELS